MNLKTILGLLIFFLPFFITFAQDTTSVNEKEFLVIVDEPPKPIGGLDALQERLVYPEKVRDMDLKGRVYIQTFINESGDVVKMNVMQGDSLMIEAALKAVQETKFTPAIHKGKPVKVQVGVPVLFNTILECKTK